MSAAKGTNIPRLIAIPSVITLAVTILRLVGEIKHWPSPWVNSAAGGPGAIIGIAWLPIIFGPYFALKLAGAGEGPASYGRAIGYAFAGLVVFFIAGGLFQHTIMHPSWLTMVAFVLMLVSAFVPPMGWRSLGRALLGYALASRIPVLIVMYYAMTGNGGAGLGTHYDAAPPALAQLSFESRYILAAVVPQMTLWIAWTVILGAIFGGVAAAVARKDKRPASATA
jgi:hypothetical protein